MILKTRMQLMASLNAQKTKRQLQIHLNHLSLHFRVKHQNLLKTSSSQHISARCHNFSMREAANCIAGDSEGNSHFSPSLHCSSGEGRGLFAVFDQHDVSGRGNLCFTCLVDARTALSPKNCPAFTMLTGIRLLLMQQHMPRYLTSFLRI
jgi:hypothetical protein